MDNNKNNKNNTVVIRQVFKNRYLLKTIFKHAHQLSLNQLTFDDGRRIPKLYTYNQLTSIGWMIKNGYISLLRSKINRGDYLKLPKSRKKIQMIFCAISDQTLLDRIISLDKWYFCHDQIIPYACSSGNVSLVDKILKHKLFGQEFHLPIDPYLMLDRAMVSGSLDMVRYLDTMVDKCNIAKLDWGVSHACKTTSSDVVKYFLDKQVGSKERSKVIDSFPLLIASTNPLHPISPYLKRNETFLSKDHTLSFINTFVLFKQELWEDISKKIPYLDKSFLSYFPKPLLSILRDYDRDEKVKEILENNRPFFNRIGDLLVEIGTAKYGSSATIKAIQSKAALILKGIDDTHCTYKLLSNALIAIELFQQRLMLDLKVEIGDFAILIGVEDIAVIRYFTSAAGAPQSILTGYMKGGWKVKKAHQIRLHYTSPYTPLCYYVKYAQLDMIQMFLQSATDQDKSGEVANSAILTRVLVSHNIETAELVFQTFGRYWDTFFNFSNDHLYSFSVPSSMENNLFKIVSQKSTSTLSTNEILEIIVSSGNFKLFDYFSNNLIEKNGNIDLEQSDVNMFPFKNGRKVAKGQVFPSGKLAHTLKVFIATNQVERLETFISIFGIQPQSQEIVALSIKYGKLDIINRMYPKVFETGEELLPCCLKSSQLPILLLFIENLIPKPTCFISLIGMAGSFGRVEVTKYLFKLQGDKGWNKLDSSDKTWNKQWRLCRKDYRMFQPFGYNDNNNNFSSILIIHSFLIHDQIILYACSSGNVSLVDKILKHKLFGQEFQLPISPYLMLDRAMASGSLDMVRYLDTMVDKCNIAKLNWGNRCFCKTTSSDVVKYFLDRVKTTIRVVDSFPLLIASTNPLHPISPYLKRNETFLLSQEYILSFINTFVFFKQGFWEDIHLDNRIKNTFLTFQGIDSTHCTYKPLSNAMVDIQLFQKRIRLDKRAIADFVILIGVEDIGAIRYFASAAGAPQSSST
ncbi:hypothetical protein DFA_07791 [Cavenderia fasciculata]|uniref:Uncharacterized protein n=1 Tax=Cavenderia fasciculata TaxID=261658 RepID=F4Q3E4_CACFS|nr:uncharacterized protein DFA_07791 [Cavenderia fasciculata]EGG16813.1 hypothetical protein DFA_07791 [Cavenderia fasciculata]|eukprot:XP_004355287.1 hypothetical protein DFA_07791 [Cavenderia fasciculata]